MNIYKKKFNEFYSDFLTSDEFTDLEIIDKILEKVQKEAEKKFKNLENMEKNKKSKKAVKEALKCSRKF